MWDRETGSDAALPAVSLDCSLAGEVTKVSDEKTTIESKGKPVTSWTAVAQVHKMQSALQLSVRCHCRSPRKAQKTTLLSLWRAAAATLWSSVPVS